MNDIAQAQSAPVPITPAQELDQLRADRASGKLDDWTWNRGGKQARFEELATSLASALPAAQQLSQQQASARLEQLRQLRIEGKASPADVSEFERLAAAVTGESVEAQPRLTIDEQLQQQIDVQMTPAQPQEYAFEYPIGYQPTTEEHIAWDSEVRKVFSTAGIPKHLGGPIHGAIERVAVELCNAPPEQREGRIAETTASLRQRWGTEFDKRIDAIDALVFEATEKHPQFAEMIYSAPWLLADPAIMGWLDTVAQHRASKAQR